MPDHDRAGLVVDGGVTARQSPDRQLMLRAVALLR
jgi:hypothetical protein